MSMLRAEMSHALITASVALDDFTGAGGSYQKYVSALKEVERLTQLEVQTSTLNSENTTLKISEKFKHALFQLEQANDLFRHRGLIEPDYSKVLKSVISAMEATLVMDDLGICLQRQETSKIFASQGFKDSFMDFYWSGLQFFIHWYNQATHVKGWHNEVNTDKHVCMAFIYLTHITAVLLEVPAIKSA